MRSRSLVRLPALLLVLLLILAAGCSDSGDDGDASSDDDDTEQVDETTGGGDDADNDDSGSEGSGGGGEFAQFCGAFRGVLESYSASSDSAEEAFDAYVAALKELDPPDAIDGAWQTAVATFDTPDVALTPDQSAAFDQVDGWVIENCGFNPDEVSGSSG